MPGTDSLVDAARVVGGYVWLEERLFEIVGRWVPDVPEPDVKARLDAASFHHAWHASLWRERLPALREIEAEQFVAAPPGLEVFVAALGTAATTVEKLVGLYRVALPRQVARYQRHLERASPITDGPTIRALHLVLADEWADWRDGELVIQPLLAAGDDVRRAAAHQAQLETLILVGGGGRESNPPDGDRPSQPL